MTPGERIDRAGNVGLRQIEPGARDQFERGQLVGAGGACMGEEAHRVLDPCEGDKRGLDFARFREQLDRRRGDDAERALAADKQMLQVVARIVLAQAAQPVPDAAVGQHDLDA